nr:hypothetical protein Itr_chr11CG01300 [Ipomoea trifida]
MVVMVVRKAVAADMAKRATNTAAIATSFAISGRAKWRMWSACMGITWRAVATLRHQVSVFRGGASTYQ